jgi:3-dehydroquinate synthase
LLDGEMRQRLSDLLAQRGPHYDSFEIRLETDRRGLDELLWEAQVGLGAFHVTGMQAGYDVRILPGSLDDLGSALRRRSLNGPLALVSDENVAPLYAQRALAALKKAGYRAALIRLPAGEAHKTVASVERLWAEMLRAGLERGGTLLALGGGVIGDLAGFAAATYMRGIRWVVVPTSLLAMVDASLGGKTGADLPQGKNLVGAFHPPSLVLADPETLATLPQVEVRNGMAEVVKHGVLADPLLFEMSSQGLERLGDRWSRLVRRAVAVKVAVIQEDPFEKGRRASLNLGHTLGHAIELASDFNIKHGEAVAIGMVAAARLAEKNGLAEPGLVGQITRVLERWGLPLEIPPGLDSRRILEGIKRDKKRAGGVARFVLPVRVGEVRWGVPVENLDSLFY